MFRLRWLVPRMLCVLVLSLFVPSLALAQAPDPSTRPAMKLAANLVSGLSLLPAAVADVDPQQAPPPPPPPAANKPRHEGFGVGVKGGFLFASLGDVDPNGNPIQKSAGTSIGIFFGGNRPGTVGVMGEIMYNKRTAKFTANTDNKLSLYSLEIPILLRINGGSPNLSGVSGYFLVGPAVDIQLKQKLNDISISDKYEGVNVDLIVGGGVEITRFIIELRGDWGLRNVNKGNFGNTTKINTKTVAVLFGFRFN